MHVPGKLVLAGALFGLIPIGLGIAALVTQSWINLQGVSPNPITYGLFSCNNILCSTKSGFPIVQGLEIAGVAAIAVGVIIAVLLHTFFKHRWIRLLSQIFLFAGPTLILIGLLLYAKYSFVDLIKTISGPAAASVALNLEYSIILIIITCILGFLTAVYFAFVAGFGRHHDHVSHHHSSPIVIVQESHRF